MTDEMKNGKQEYEQESKDDGIVIINDSGAGNNNADAQVSTKSPKQRKGFAAFWHKNKRNKVLVIIGALILLLVIRGMFAGGNNDSGDSEEYDWPTTELAATVPVPEGKITYLSVDNEDYISADIECDEDYYKEYKEACKEKGFTVGKDESQSGDSYYYEAKNKEGISLSLNYISDEMSLNLQAPSEEAAAEKESEEDSAEQKEQSTKKQTEKKTEGSAVSADFKEMMDGYEEFMDEYIAFMKEYNESDDVTSMLSDYSELMEEYAEYTEKIEKVDESSLSDADLAYYNKVVNRVNKKLTDAAL